MMRFRKRWLAKINIAFTNRITGLFAGWLPGFGILTHVGRKSGKVYQTPVNVFRTSEHGSGWLCCEANHGRLIKFPAV